MGVELGDETYIHVRVVSSALSPPIFHLDREHRYLYEFSVEKFVLLSFRGYLGEIESQRKKLRTSHVLLFCMCSVASGFSNFQVLTR